MNSIPTMEKHRTKRRSPVLSVEHITNGRRKGLLTEKSRKNRLSKQREEDTYISSGLETTHYQEMSISDSESSNSNSNSYSNSNSRKKTGFFCGENGLVRLGEEDKDFNIIKKNFLSGMGSFGSHTSVVSVHKNRFSSLSGQARSQSFRIFSEATAKKCSSGNANVKFAWYGSSKNEIDSIINHGFGQCRRPDNGGLFGSGVYLSPEGHSLDGAISSIIDESGLQHVLLCRVILGNMEVVHSGSEQFHPSSEEFDSGVDNLISPKRYIVWSTHMNTHILPEYLISFKAPSILEGFSRIQEELRKPKSAWLPFPTLISQLAKFLPPNTIGLIEKHHSDYREKKIARQYLIQRLRQIAGDKLLITVIQSFQGKKLESTADALQPHIKQVQTSLSCSPPSSP